MFQVQGDRVKLSIATERTTARPRMAIIHDRLTWTARKAAKRAEYTRCLASWSEYQFVLSMNPDASETLLIPDATDATISKKKWDATTTEFQKSVRAHAVSLREAAGLPGTSEAVGPVEEDSVFRNIGQGRLDQRPLSQCPWASILGDAGAEAAVARSRLSLEVQGDRVKLSIATERTTARPRMAIIHDRLTWTARKAAKRAEYTRCLASWSEYQFVLSMNPDASETLLIPDATDATISKKKWDATTTEFQKSVRAHAVSLREAAGLPGTSEAVGPVEEDSVFRNIGQGRLDQRPLSQCPWASILGDAGAEAAVARSRLSLDVSP